jgi:hypothetical protein
METVTSVGTGIACACSIKHGGRIDPEQIQRVGCEARRSQDMGVVENLKLLLTFCEGRRILWAGGGFIAELRGRSGFLWLVSISRGQLVPERLRQ